MNNRKPYITISYGIGGYYAVQRAYYEDIQDYDNTCTGIGRYKTYKEAKEEAQEWAKVEGIDFDE
jgi:hypothetical protein